MPGPSRYCHPIFLPSQEYSKLIAKELYSYHEVRSICLPGTFTHLSCSVPLPETTQCAANPSSSGQAALQIFGDHRFSMKGLFCLSMSIASALCYGMWFQVPTPSAYYSLVSHLPPVLSSTDFIKICWLGIEDPIGSSQPSDGEVALIK